MRSKIGRPATVLLWPLVLLIGACAGDVGPTGPQGANGAPGPAGPVGPQGPAGPQGTSFSGRVIYAIDAANNLLTFGALTPGTRTTQVAVTGLSAGETIAGIDFRPASDTLYAVSTSSRLYTINTASGAATAAGGGSFGPALSGGFFGVGFNPAVDRLRIHSDTEQNLRINQTSSPPAVTADAALAYSAGDPGFGANPNITSTAYTLSVRPAPASTELFAIDSGRDVLLRVTDPNGGALATVGGLAFDTSNDVGLDIAGDTDVAYATMTPAGAPSGPSRLFTINLRSGAATMVGQVGHATPLRSIAVAPGGPPAPSRRPRR